MLEVATHHITRHRDLDFLLQGFLEGTNEASVQNSHDCKPMPTWIPKAWCGRDINDTARLYTVKAVLTHNCSEHCIDMEKMQLRARGVKVDTVQHHYAFHNPWLSTVSQFWLSPVGAYLQTHSSTNWSNLPHDLFRALTSEPIARDLHYEEVTLALSRFFELHQDPTLAECVIGYRPMNIVEQMPAVPRAALARLLDDLNETALIRTKSELHGLVPNCNIMEGDEIWILLGCVLPVVVRRHPNGTYWHVSAARIPSLQDHEDLQYLKTESMPGDKVGDWMVEDIILE